LEFLGVAPFWLSLIPPSNDGLGVMALLLLVDVKGELAVAPDFASVQSSCDWDLRLMMA